MAKPIKGSNGLAVAVSTLWAVLRGLCILAALAVAVTWTFPPLRKVLEREGLLGPDAAMGVVAFLVFSVLATLEGLQRRFTALDKAQTSPRNGDLEILKGGTDVVYKEIKPFLKQRRWSGSHLTVDVLGFTLFSIVPRLRRWLTEGSLKKMTLKLHALNPEYIKSEGALPNRWAQDVEHNLDELKDFVQRYAAALTEQGATIEVYLYDHLPSVHGMRVGDHALYVSISDWNGDMVELPSEATFIKVSVHDTSDLAVQLRALYCNWVKAASSAPPVLVTGSPPEEPRHAAQQPGARTPVNAAEGDANARPAPAVTTGG
jgi:hypothetical protein